MKQIILFLILFTQLLWTNGQSNIRINNYWDNTYYINPASINDKYLSVYSMAVRKQWVSFPGSPTTAFATATKYIDASHTQYGLKVFEDKIGYTLTSNLALSYAYSVNLDYVWKLNLGLAASFQNMTYDLNMIDLPTKDDPTVYKKLAHINNFNADMGLELTNKNWRIGASSQNIFSLFFAGDKQQINSNFAYAIYRQVNENMISYGGGTTLIQYRNLTQMELNVTSYFKSNRMDELFQVGAFYRPKSELGAIVGFNLSQAILLSYSYDFNVGGISRSSVGSHELMLTYRMYKCPTCY
jgi:type IX secretion system PorP/SprF family membrane protein